MRPIGFITLFSLGLGCQREPAHTTKVTLAAAPSAHEAPPIAEPGSPHRPRALTIATKTRARSAPPKPGASTTPGTTSTFEPNAPCEESLAWPVVRGAATPEIDASISRALENDRWILDDTNLSDCTVGRRARASRGFEVLMNDKGVLAVRQTETSQYEGSISPPSPGPERWLAFDVETGEAFSWRQLVGEAPSAKSSLAKLLSGCVRTYVREVNGGDEGALRDMLEKVDLDQERLLALPTPRGLRFGALGYTPQARVLEGQGPIVTWSALVRVGALRGDGVASRLTEGISAAGPSHEVCHLPD
jgi:hypothetical protein